ncbi:hypothetical protein KIW84_053207 [Lathyrus oleraceus]|uniref:Uncharacterized protein n=1 Tax=Pisum sativum TaxID=3888 RepID=A0A9D4WS80_PEA|nr:hypothetical protein KIW84_053207 [Pisum sativum]
MENNNNRWFSPTQAYTGSNHGEQPQPESGGGRGNDDGREDGVQEESSVITNNSSNDENNENNNNIFVGSNDGNNGNKNNIVFGDNYSNIGGNDQEGPSRKWKLGFLTRAVAEPTTGDSCYKQWKSEKSLIIAWLVSSMETRIGKPYMFLPSTKDV